MRKILIIGSGAQAKYVLENFINNEKYLVNGILPLTNNSLKWVKFYNIKIYNGKDFCEIVRKNKLYGVIVCEFNSKIKKKIINKIKKNKIRLVSSIHKDASISHKSRISKGVIINAGVVVQPFSSIGVGCMIHANSIIEHDVRISSYVNISPGVNIAGHVKVGSFTNIYTGSTIINNCKIGSECIIGAGSVVISNIKSKSKFAGVPAKSIKY